MLAESLLSQSLKNAEQDATEELNLLTGVDEHLQFVTSVIERNNIAAANCCQLRQQIERIQKRCRDPKLYLAVVGEFSSGKSTFINALLRDELLKTSVLPTTAAATKLRHGNHLQVEVQLKAPRPGTIKTQPNSQRITVPWLPGVNRIDNRKFIHILTAHEAVAKNVVDLTITHPAAFLANGIVVIDTPGTNATSEQHGEVTRQVVEREADAAIIIIPATVPLSQTLSNFLASSLRPFLHRCLFVVTQMDKIRQREQSQLLNHLRARLVEKLALKSPVLYSCSAQVVIDDLTGEEPISPRLKDWTHRFEQLENVMLGRLAQERLVSVSESVLRLLRQLIEQLDGHLRSQWQQYENSQAAIEREILPTLDSFTAQHYHNCNQIVADAKIKTASKVDKFVEKQQQTTISTIKNRIFEAQDWQALEKVVKTGAEEKLKDTQVQIQQELAQTLQLISQAAEQASQQFARTFAEAYQRLEVIGGSVTPTSLTHKSIQLNSSDIFASMQSLNQDLDNKENKIVLGGTATGAALGTVILPGIGTVIGGFVGFFVSVGMSVSADKRKQQLWEQLSPELNVYFDRSKEQVRQAVEAYGQSVAAALNEWISTYVAQYKETVDAIINQQQIQLQHLTDLKTTVQADRQEIEQRRQILLAQQRRLAAIEIK